MKHYFILKMETHWRIEWNLSGNKDDTMIILPAKYKTEQEAAIAQMKMQSWVTTRDGST